MTTTPKRKGGRPRKTPAPVVQAPAPKPAPPHAPAPAPAPTIVVVTDPLTRSGWTCTTTETTFAGSIGDILKEFYRDPLDDEQWTGATWTFDGARYMTANGKPIMNWALAADTERRNLGTTPASVTLTNA